MLPSSGSTTPLPAGFPIKQFPQGEHQGILHLTSIRGVDSGNALLHGMTGRKVIWPLRQHPQKAASMRHRGKLAFGQNFGITVLGDSVLRVLIWGVLLKEPSLNFVTMQLIYTQIYSIACSGDVP